MKLVTGENMIKMLPEKLMPKIRIAFQDIDLSFDEDIQDCVIHYNQHQGSCFLIHKYVDQFEKGKLICTFNEDGTGFHWGQGHLHLFDKE